MIRTIAIVLFAALVATSAVGEQTLKVRSEVGHLLQDSISAVNAGDYKGAMDLARRAEQIDKLTNDELAAIAQMKDYIDSKSGGTFDAFSAGSAQTKFAADYNAERYREAIDDEQVLLKFGALTAKDVLVIQQAYYKLGDYKGCARYASVHDIPIENSTELQLRCLWFVNDSDFVRPSIVRLLGIAEVAALAGCHGKAVAHWQMAVAIGDLNPDEQSIANRMERLIASKASLPDGGEICRDPKLEDDTSWQSVG